MSASLTGRRWVRRTSRWLLVLTAAVALLPAAAVAEQSSQPASPEAGYMTTGDFHSCAVLPSELTATLRCWGYGGDGVLGYGNTTTIGDDETPASVAPVDLGSARVIAIGAGSVHTCALLTDGSVRCWGYGGNGRLGYRSTDSVGAQQPAGSVGPVDLGEGRTAKAITAGNGHTCAVLDDGSVRCWGFGSDGRLGYGNPDTIGDDETPGSVGPVTLGPGRTARAISAGGFHTCALLDDGSVRCWGVGDQGRLGYANTATTGRTPQTTPDKAGPVNLGEGHTAKAITAGFGHTCAILDDDTVRCWGSGGSGRLGYGNRRDIGSTEVPGSVGPVDLGPGRTAKAISAGNEHTCAVLDNGSVRCWGFGGFGQLGYGHMRSVGDDEPPSSVPPVELGPGRTATAISAGQSHTCARLDDGSVRCWGYGANGRLGHCSETAIGDDESPASIGPVALGMPGIAGQGCASAASPEESPAAAAPVAPAPVVAAPPLPARPSPPATNALAAALAAQNARALGLRSCLRGAARKVDASRRRTRRMSSQRRRRALRQLDRRAVRLRTACLRQHGRTPGRVTSLTARGVGNGSVRLSFRAVGTDGSNAPAATSYVVKQSRRPIRSARDFSRAPSLCRGRCSFNVTSPDATVTLTITDLRRGPYHYAVAARDNVSGRVGPRSATVRVRVR